MESKPALQIAVNIIRRIWLNSWIISLVVMIFLGLTLYILEGFFNFASLSKILAGTACFMIGASFAMSGFCYYWDFLDKKIIYRKYLGVIGFIYALAYSLTLVILDPERYFYHLLDNLYDPEIILGLSAMTIFTFMFVISRTKIMLSLGPQLWRKLLRVGYLAYFLLVVRAWYIEKDLWYDWFSALEGFPPPRLLMAAFAILVVLFRISIDFSKMIKNNKPDLNPGINS